MPLARVRFARLRRTQLDVPVPNPIRGDAGEEEQPPPEESAEAI